MTALASYLPGPKGYVLHSYNGQDTLLDQEACQRIADWLERQIESPSWSDMLTEARKGSLAALRSAMAASFPQHQQEAAE